MTGILTSNSRDGDFVHATQPMNRKFSNISDLWAGKDSWARKEGLVMEWDDLFQLIEKEHDISYDVQVTPHQVKAIVHNGNCKLEINAGDFAGVPLQLTKHTIQQLGGPTLSGSGYATLDQLTRENTDEQDQEIAAHIINNSIRHLREEKGDKNFLFRLRVPNTNNGSVRAILTERYARINHDWFANVLREMVPEGLVSHLRFDHGDKVEFNLMIPDTQRAEEDSGYGGMLSVGNSEIGNGRAFTKPSLFRAICMNGCVWGETVGDALNKVHRGNVDLGAFRIAIRENLQTQIPLLPVGIDMLMRSKALTFEEVSPQRIITRLSRVNGSGLNKPQARTILDAFNIEPINSAFGIINSFTRAAQDFGGNEQGRVEALAGSYMESWVDETRGQSRWDRLIAQAKDTSDEEVNKIFAIG
jgi:hypothetical protein